MHAIVHIGAPKAGSSAIQYAIGLNAEQIAAQGVYPYRPSVGPVDRALSTRFRPGQKNLPPDVRLKLKDARNAQEWSQRSWDELAATLCQDRPELTLISSEDLFGLPSPGDFIAALRELFTETTLIAYVRDPVAQFLSQANQQIRGGARFRDLKTPLDYRYYVRTNLEGYLDAVGRGRIVVRNIDPANLRDGDRLADERQRDLRALRQGRQTHPQAAPGSHRPPAPRAGTGRVAQAQADRPGTGGPDLLQCARNDRLAERHLPGGADPPRHRHAARAYARGGGGGRADARLA